MSWKQILGLVVLCAIVLIALWPRRRRRKPGGLNQYDQSNETPYAGQDTGFGHGGGGHDGGGHGGH